MCLDLGVPNREGAHPCSRKAWTCAGGSNNATVDIEHLAHGLYLL